MLHLFALLLAMAGACGCTASPYSPNWNPPCGADTILLPAATSEDIGFEINSGVVTFPKASLASAGKAPVVILHNGFMLIETMYQQYANLLAGFGFVVVQYNLPHLKRTDFDTEARSLPLVLRWVKKQLSASLTDKHVPPDWSTVIAAGHSRGGWIAFKQLQQARVVTAALLDAVAPPGAIYESPPHNYLVVEGMRSPVCAPAALGFIQRRFTSSPKPLPFTRVKMPQAGHMQYCKTGRAAPFWNVVCGCGQTPNEGVLHQAAALLVGYLLEYGYSTLSEDSVKTSVAAFTEWRNELFNSGVFQNYDNNHASYDKREVHALNTMPSFIHDDDDNDGWTGEVDIAVTLGTAVDTESSRSIVAPVEKPAADVANGEQQGTENKAMFAQKLDMVEADLLAHRSNLGSDE